MRYKNQIALIDSPVLRSAYGKAPTCRRHGFVIAAAIFPLATWLLSSTIASAESAHGKRPLSRPWHGYGFLPGYQPPELIEWERGRTHRPTYWYGGPGFYRGRWNGGGFGPCWTPTPIGPHWNCG